MATNLNLNAEPQKGLGHSGNGYVHDLDRQRLRILRCTAQAMASSPGGLRFKAGTQPWLDGIATGGSGWQAAAQGSFAGRLRLNLKMFAAPSAGLFFACWKTRS